MSTEDSRKSGSESNALLSCPWCGKTDALEVCGEPGSQCVTCWHCEIDGPEEDPTEDISAIELWNDRPVRFANGQHVFNHYGVPTETTGAG